VIAHVVLQQRRRSRSAAFACAFTLTMACAHLARAQSAPADPDARPTYQQYRYDEDWSVLKDARRHRDVWDGIKFVPLKDDDWYLSVGGEARWRYEQVRQPGFGSQPDDPTGYALQRYLLHTDWHLGTRARAFIEIQSGLEAGRNGGPRPTDKNTLDLHEAFLDVKLRNSNRGSVALRLGRHEVGFGAGRLISAAEGLNVRRSFDGGRLIVKRGGWTWNSTAMRLVLAVPGVFDDHSDSGLLCWGAGGNGPRPWLGPGNLAVYYIGVRRKNARFDQGTADATRHSGGIRVWGSAGRADYDEEVIVQWGTFGRDSIRAYAIASDVGWVLASVAGHPRLGARVFATSGDRDPVEAKLNSFDPLFPSIAYSGKAGLIGPTNLVTVDPTLSFAPHRLLRVTTDCAMFWRTSTNDGVYGINVAVLRTGQKSDARFVGSQATVELDARLTMHLSVWASLVYFNTGAFLRETPPGLDTRYVAAHVSYRF
jgi:Alginate export